MKVLFITMLALVAGFASAQESEDPRGYGGVKRGFWSWDLNQIVDDASIKGNFNDVAWGFYGGYMWTPNLGVEVDVGHLKKAQDTVTITDRFGTPTEVRVSVTQNLWAAVSFKPTLPIGNDVDLFAKVGLALTKAKFNGCRRGTCFSDSGNDLTFIWGLGVEWHGENPLNLRGEIQSHEFPDALIYTIGVGLTF